MTTERELREQEEKMQQFLEEERNPYSWRNGKWFLITVTLLIVIAFIVA